MSSILRALRRLEDDNRPSDDDATLREHVVIPETRRSPPVPRIVALAAIAAGVVVLALAAQSLLRGPGPAPSAEGVARPASPWAAATAEERTPVSPSAPSPAAVGSLRAEPLPGVSAPARVDGAGSAAVMARRTPVATIEAPPAPARAPVATPQPPARAPVATSPSRAAARGVFPSSPRDASVETPSLAARAAPAPAPKSATVSAPAHARGASRNATPVPVGVERILWHPKPAKRRAWLRMDGAKESREVREGEAVGKFAVDQIDAGSVLFRSGATEIRYKLGAKY